MKTKRYGFKQYRLNKHDPYYDKEVKFSKEFHSFPMDWDYIVFGMKDSIGYSSPKDFLSERERHIVASTIQWLGTPVGESFLDTCDFMYTPFMEERYKNLESRVKKMSIWKFLKWRKENDR